VTAEAQERSAQVLTETQQRSSAHLIEAQERAAALIGEAESTAGQIDHDARLAAERLVESAKVNGEALVEGAREQGRAIVEQSYDARKAVLNDLAVKRKRSRSRSNSCAPRVTFSPRSSLRCRTKLKMCSPESTTPMKWLATRRSRPCDFDRTCPSRPKKRSSPHTTAKGLRADTARGDRSARRDENTRP